MLKFLSINVLVILVLICLTSSHTIAQTILIQPYLQHATPTSIVIMWETNTNTQSTIQYGLTQSLGNTASGTTLTTPGNTILHTVTLTGLTPATRHYYKAITDAWQSNVFDFVTPPLRNSEANVNLVLMSDMQKDGSNPTIFSNLINTSLLPYIATEYGSPLSDHLQMAILPGDVVDAGNTFSQWKNDFFNPGEVLWRSVPSYPAIGNHEANSQNYFNYYNLPPNGTPGYLEHWYYHDYSNIRVISINSNPAYRLQVQLDWLDSILMMSCADTLIDFVFAEMHHPYLSELWTPGEADYTGDVVERMEAFSDTCGKPTVHFFGHTHAYSRGQSRDHDHLWVNVATSGGNIDYWGEFENQDYDEFIISQDEYGFVMVEVTAGDNPQMVLKRLSFGDQYNPGGSTETDFMAIRFNNNPPATPLTLFPTSADTVSALCFTMQADGFSDPDGDAFGAAHWQISTDSNNFSTPVFESWKQYANWYNEINEQANDDLTNEEVVNLQPDNTYWWRVRYRDKSLEWSPWSTTSRFETKPLDTLTSNLVLNPDAESGIVNWTATIGVIESLGPGECAGINPYQGQKYFGLGALCVDHPFGSAYQDLNISAFSAQVDSGNVLAHYGAYMADWQNTDEPAMALLFLDAGNNVISATDTLRHRMSAWTLKQNTISVPESTRKIRCLLMGKRFAGSDNDSYIDNVFCKLYAGDLSCSTYAPPGPANGRIYVDTNAVGYPDGKNWNTAYRTLGDALLQSNADTLIQEIWVADGTYYVSTATARDTSFLVTRAITIYGGFAGFETDITQRDIPNHATILSGEIADPSLVNDNCYHVLEIHSTQDTLLFDGLIVRDGYADGPLNQFGGGVYIAMNNREPVVFQYCLFENNYAIKGSSVFNQSKAIFESSVINNEVIEGTTGCSILNAGPFAHLTLNNISIEQHCNSCPEVIQNINGASLMAIENVSIEKE
jgi:purple acid phosphatase-like protein/calcineurin-like phosphoesterase family protein